MQAGADEVPTTPAAATASPEPARDPDVATPPPLLPWGDVPEELDVAKAGTDSEKLGDTGADAAPQSATDPTGLDPEQAPKGFSGADGAVATAKAPVPPRPPGRVLAAPVSGARINYHYGVGSQKVESAGAYANLSIGKPYLDRRDAHTLAEIAVQARGSSDKKQHIVEFGWNVDRTIYNDDDPHMFVYHWVDGKETCYNGCGFITTSKTVAPGATLPEGELKKFGIQHGPDGWWVAYDTEWIGYFPDELWDGAFTVSDSVQFFGEVASATETPCTDMGNGRSAMEDPATKFNSIALVNKDDPEKTGPAPDLRVRSQSPVNGVMTEPSRYYDVNKAASGRTFRFGGLGAC